MKPRPLMLAVAAAAALAGADGRSFASAEDYKAAAWGVTVPGPMGFKEWTYRNGEFHPVKNQRKARKQARRQKPHGWKGGAK